MNLLGRILDHFTGPAATYPWEEPLPPDQAKITIILDDLPHPGQFVMLADQGEDKLVLMHAQTFRQILAQAGARHLDLE